MEVEELLRGSRKGKVTKAKDRGAKARLNEADVEHAGKAVEDMSIK